MILVAGAGGMLGTWLCAKYPKDVLGFSRTELDITDESGIERCLKHLKPDVVINAAGIVKNRDVSSAQMYLVNAASPHKLARVCRMQGIRLIHISTDCVFSGLSGQYTELDIPDAEDVYGRSKRLGEIQDVPDQLTIRTSFVGWPDPTNRGLLAWLREQPASSTVSGYTRSMWNGLTVNALSEYLMEYAYNRSSGVLHLFGETVSKYTLLETVNRVYNWGYVIHPQDKPVRDMTLVTVRSDGPEKIENLEKALGEMRKWETRIRAYQLR